MKVTIFGARGSLPICDQNYMEFGGNTTCFLIEDDQENQIIVDSGTGIRNLGKSDVLNQNKISIVLTHFHWDHIQGFPFFSPAYNKQSKIQIMALEDDMTMPEFKARMESQMKPSFFPVGIYDMGANISLKLYDQERLFLHSGFMTETIQLNHPGGCRAIKVVDQSGKSIIVMTDHEHEEMKINPKYINFCKGADLLIHDAHYTESERAQNVNWGHSSFDQAIRLTEEAGVKKLLMTHHNPDYNDLFLSSKEKEYQFFMPHVTIAREGETYSA